MLLIGDIMKNNIDIVDKINCYGCGACEASCPKSCIKMEYNEEGFLMPYINNGICINCGQCLKSCPIKKVVKISDLVYPEAHMVLGKEDAIVEKSASGGAFSIIASFFVNELKGYVVGSVINNDGIVEHIITDNINDISKIQGSKYVQSDISKILVKTKIMLNSGKYVLFSGTPCQTAALKTFLGADYKNLYLMDLVCHGVPSPKVFQTVYLDLKEKYPFDEITFRYKNKFEKTEFAFSLYKDNKLVKRIPWENSGYYSLFIENKNYRKSCYDCELSSIQRSSDFTIGDCGSWNYHRDFFPDKATSLLLINSKKGKELWKTLSPYFFDKNINLENEIKCNHSLTNSNKMKKRLSDEEMSKLNDLSFMDDFKKGKSIKKNIKKQIKRFISVKTREKLKTLMRIK